jgi:hypothetical protein
VPAPPAMPRSTGAPIHYYGAKPCGFIIYTATGQVSVHIAQCPTPDASPSELAATYNGYFGTYMPSVWDEIPDSLKDPDGHWVGSYYGVMKIGGNNTIVPDFQPTSFADLRNAPAGTVALNDDPAAKAYQEAIFQKGRPAAMFYTDDVKADYERIKGRGATFTMPPTEVTGSTIAMLNDTCGNLIQIVQLARYPTS